VVGTFTGALPGAGADIAAWAAYGLEQKIARDPQRFGQGTEDGVIAPASAHNGAVAGAWIPALVFGIPGDSVTAIVIGAMLMYNLKPGPLIFEQSGDQVQTIFAIALITQFLLLPCGYLGIKRPSG
jgi:putative tricarboxylic transport membrane protein